MLTQAREKYHGVLTVARNLCQQDPDWVTFFREVLGIEGIVRRAFTTPEELAEFETSEEHGEIQKMLTKLRERRGVPEKQTEPTRVITVRIPKSMHDSLLSEAGAKRTSMNKLCISKLLQVIDQEFVPTPPVSASSRRRKKKRLAAAAPSPNGAPAHDTPAERQERSAEEDL